MHFIFLIEDQSGKHMLDGLKGKMLSKDDSCEIHHYRGVGHLPANLVKGSAKSQCLLDNLPRLLRGMRKAFKQCPHHFVVICDLDRNQKADFLQKLEDVAVQCQVDAETSICLAIEEGEAWLLGDRQAVLEAYPDAKLAVLNKYVQDSICGTWEVLADAIYPGGRKELKKLNPGALKCEWAQRIAPKMDIERNVSPSFRHFVEQVRIHRG